ARAPLDDPVSRRVACERVIRRDQPGLALVLYEISFERFVHFNEITKPPLSLARDSAGLPVLHRSLSDANRGRKLRLRQAKRSTQRLDVNRGSRRGTPCRCAVARPQLQRPSDFRCAEAELRVLRKGPFGHARPMDDVPVIGAAGIEHHRPQTSLDSRQAPEGARELLLVLLSPPLD